MVSLEEIRLQGAAYQHRQGDHKADSNGTGLPQQDLQGYPYRPEARECVGLPD